MEEIEKLYLGMTSEMLYIILNRPAWNQEIPVAACKLKSSMVDDWPPRDVNTEFVSINISKLEDFPITGSILNQAFQKHLKYIQETLFFEGRLDLEVASCIAKTKMVDFYYDSTCKTNEASVRIKYANNIVIMLCAVHNLTFRVEDRLIHPESLETNLGDVVSARSTTDYTCYRVTNSLRLVAVLLETKVAYHNNSLAQLLGYYMASCANIWQPGVCILLASDELRIILFPFWNQHPLINAICMKPINYKDHLDTALKLLAIATHPNFSFKLNLDSQFLPVEKDFCFEVESAQMTRLRELEHEMSRMKEEILKLRCQAIPVRVHVVKDPTQ